MGETPEDIKAAAKNVRARLCIDSECDFDNGCGCLAAIVEALTVERVRSRRERAPEGKSSLDEAIATVQRDLPGWWWKVGSCSVSDDACLAPDFNDPIHGERLKKQLFPIASGSELDAGFDVAKHPPGDVAGALLEALAMAKAYLKERSL